MKKHLLFFITCLFFTVSYSQSVENQSSLSIEQIMQAKDFVGHWVERPFWSADSKTIYFNWNPEKDTLASLYKVAASGGTPEKVSIEEQMKMPTRFGTFNKDRTKKVHAKNGDIFLLDIASGNNLQITNTVQRESSPQFSGDEKSIIFNIGDNLFAWHMVNGTIAQITNFVSGSEKTESTLSEYEQWLENDQYEWHEILDLRKRQRELREERSDAMKVDRPLPIYLDKKRLSSVEISPDLKFVVYRLSKSPRNTGTKVPDYVTGSGFAKMLNARSKVGAPQTTYESWVFDIEKDTTYKIDITQLEGIKDKPAFLKDYHEGEEDWDPQYEKPRKVLMHGPIFSKESKAVVIFRSLDNKDRWIAMLNPTNGELKLLDRQHDEAWIGGPGISGWNGSTGTIGWMGDDKTIYYQSEETGFSHLYAHDVESGQRQALTKGDFEILSVQLSMDKSTFYIESNKDDAHQHHLFSMPAGGGEMTKITSMVGGHETLIAPDESMVAFRYSTSTTPWDLYIMPNEAGAKANRLTKSTTPEFESYNWRTPEIVYFEAADGQKVPAKLYKPANPQPGGAGVIFVHGAGYLQNVHKWWPSYYREQMFHNILADNGVTVLDIDFRASNGYGRDWRTAIYRFMGGADLDDQVDGAKFLVEEHGVDADKIGIYGGSYGGFITLMAMFTKPGTFKAGAAIRSVGDWAHYNHPYTSNILNTPVEDSIAFFKSSPIYHCEGLQDHLLILHGMIDTNVHFQDMVRVAQRLIELGKENWEMAVYPLEPHGFIEPSSWTDEYKRIYKLFMTTLK
ncbi:MAG: prolyl oligopeptidase family serine peptidase [Bacteroidota bacterium]